MEDEYFKQRQTHKYEQLHNFVVELAELSTCKMYTNTHLVNNEYPCEDD